MIRFNKPHFTGKETDYIKDAVNRGHISGNGYYTKKCQAFFEDRWGFKKCLLTTSCTDALEMSALLLDIQPGDEVIIPSYTFVSTALAFIRQGATVVFADSRTDHPGIDENQIEGLITKKTKAIIVVHYAGVACNMATIMRLSEKYGIYVVEDAAHAIDSFYYEKPLGGIGHLGTFSFHETKNIQSGEGGLLAINDERFVKRAEIIWEKGTNRAEFFRGEINRYGWVDIGSSFLPSDMIAAFLWAQIENLDNIQNKRKEIWQWYYENVDSLFGKEFDFSIPSLPEYASNNGHMYYMVFQLAEERARFIEQMNQKEIYPVFHYLSLHKSPYFKSQYKGKDLPNSDYYENCLVRMPLYYDLDLQMLEEKILSE